MESSNDGDPKKLFVGGLPRCATEETMTNYFKQFGHVMGSNIPTNEATGKSRGFGFVSFFSLESAQLALNHAEHIINGKKVEVKQASPKSSGASTCNGLPGLSKKIFVGGLPQDCTDAELRKHFESFGAVQHAFVIVNRHTGKNRGFGFVTFESYAAADNALKSRSQMLKNKLIEVKPAERKTYTNNSPTNLSGTSNGNGNGNATYRTAGPYEGLNMVYGLYYNQNDYHNDGVSPVYAVYNYNMAQCCYSPQNCDYRGWGAGYPTYLASTYNYPYLYQPLYNARGYLTHGPMCAQEQPPQQNGQAAQQPAEEMMGAVQEQPPQQNGQAGLPAEELLQNHPGGSSSSPEHVLSPEDPTRHDDQSTVQ